METQPAHLQWGAGRKLEPEARDIIRAQMIREKLQSSLPPAIDLSGKEN
jgi:protein-arginine kinase